MENGCKHMVKQTFFLINVVVDLASLDRQHTKYIYIYKFYLESYILIETQHWISNGIFLDIMQLSNINNSNPNTNMNISWSCTNAIIWQLIGIYNQ